MKPLHKLVSATQGMDFFPTACGIRDTCPDNPRSDIRVVKSWVLVTCKLCLKHKPKRKQRLQPTATTRGDG